MAQGVNISELPGRVQAVEGLAAQLQSLDNRVNTLQQQVNNLQQQLADLQRKQAQDVEGLVVSIATLAARVTNIGG
jgi:chaperonin cofactor prefoldin